MAERQIMNQEDIRRALARIAHEILERNRGTWGLVLVGIYTRGVLLANRLAGNIAEFEGSNVPVAALDINLYRDDLRDRARPVVRPTNIPVGIHAKNGGAGRRTFSTRAAPSGRQWTRSMTLGDLNRSSWPSCWIGGTGNCPFAQIYVGQKHSDCTGRAGQGPFGRGRRRGRSSNRQEEGLKGMSTSPTIETAPLTPVVGVVELPPRQHVLDLDDFSPAEISAVLDTARGMAEVLGRDIKKVPALRGRVIVTLFYESSTRTRISFEEAGKVLSADVINMSSSASSIEKGESLLNTGLTLQAMGVDVIVMRHPYSGAPYLLARHLKRVGIINAGDGVHAHPTQALLDLYTVQEKLGRLEGLKVVIVGDVLHSRVARSNLWGFTKMGARVVLCGPATLLPLDMLRRSGEDHWPQQLEGVEVDTDLDHAVSGRRRGYGFEIAIGAAGRRLLALSSGVYPPLAGDRAAAGPSQARRAGDAPRPNE